MGNVPGGEPGAGGVHFIAEMWANGGYMMVIIVSFAFGVFAQWLNQRILGLQQRTPLQLTYYGLVLFCFGLLGYGGFMTPVNRGLLTFTFLFGIMLLLSRFSARLSPSGSTAQPVEGDGQRPQQRGITPAQ